MLDEVVQQGSQIAELQAVIAQMQLDGWAPVPTPNVESERLEEEVEGQEAAGEMGQPGQSGGMFFPYWDDDAMQQVDESDVNSSVGAPLFLTKEQAAQLHVDELSPGQVVVVDGKSFLAIPETEQ